MSRALPVWAALGLCALVAALPFASLLFPEAGACLADPQGELPVKLWVYDTFLADGRLFGGVVHELRHPTPGVLNNPDPLGTLIVGGLNGVLGDCRAFNLLIFLQLFGNAAAAWLVGAQWAGDRRAGLAAAVTLGLLPLLLVYCVAGAITDMLIVWPWLLALWALREAWQRDGRGAVLHALGAGAAAALGVVTCPYNAVVFAPAVVPAGLLLAAWGPAKVGLRGGHGWRRLLLGVALVGLGATALGGPYVAWMQLMLADPDSQMTADSVARSRHAAPYHALIPAVEERYTAYLADFFEVGSGSVVLRDNVARFYRSQNPGLVAWLLLGAAALVPGGAATLRRAGVLWLTVAAFFMLAAVGPFLPLTADLALSQPRNVVWLGLHHLFPGAALLLEPFRYGLVVGAAVAIGASVGAARLAARWGAWVYAAVPALLLVEALTIAPVFRPLPTTTPQVPEVYSHLDDYLPEGAVLELPFFQFGSKLFYRSVFLHQRTHGRPIPHIVEGYPPQALAENPATANLLVAEEPHRDFEIPPAPPQEMAAGVAALKAQGYVAIIVTPHLYKSDRHRRQVRRLLDPYGPPTIVDGRWIYRL